MSLIGVDLSHHNYPFQPNFGQFQIVKATEGSTYIDNRFKCYMQENTGLMGCYHFARPDVKGNTPVREALNFVKAVKPYLGRVILVLDWEAKALNYSEDYALVFLREVKRLTGVTPIIYCSSYATKKLARVAVEKYPLWVAHYNVQSPKIYNWNSWLLWQFTSKPFDMDLFAGTADDWKKLARQG